MNRVSFDFSNIGFYLSCIFRRDFLKLYTKLASLNTNDLVVINSFTYEIIEARRKKEKS